MPFNIGDLIVLELALLKFMDGIDLSLESGKHCTEIIGKLENMMRAARAQAITMMPELLRTAGTGPPPPPPPEAQ